MPHELKIQSGDDWNRQQTSQSSIPKLLPEILGIIFQYACPTPDFHESLHNRSRNGTGGLEQSRQHFSLAAVSSGWRQVVYSTPQLWTSVVLTRNDVQLLELYITRSRTLHLELEIWNTPWRENSPCREASPLAECRILSKVASKLKSLLLVNPKDGATEYISNLKFPLLERFGILFYYGSHDLRCLELAGAPVLQHLSFHVDFCDESFFDPVSFELPWLSITSLDLEWIPISICMTALRRCQNLVEFYFQDQYDGEEHILHSPLTLPHLKQLCWPFLRGTTIRNLLRHLQTPVLQSLVLGNEPQIDEAWFDFFRNLPPTLRKLHLREFADRVSPDISYPACFFEHVPHLEELVLEGFPNRLTDDVFAALSLYDSTRGPVFLPKLRTLIVQCEPLSAKFSDLRRRMTEMTEKRFASCTAFPTCSISAVAHKDASWYTFQAIMLSIDEDCDSGSYIILSRAVRGLHIV